MKTYERICPICGHLNRKLYLEETGGMMECERCGTISRGMFGTTDSIREAETEEGREPAWKWMNTISITAEPAQQCRSAPRLS